MASNGATTIAPEDKVSVNESGKSLARVFGYLSLVNDDYPVAFFYGRESVGDDYTRAFHGV